MHRLEAVVERLAGDSLSPELLQSLKDDADMSLTYSGTKPSTRQQSSDHQVDDSDSRAQETGDDSHNVERDHQWEVVMDLESAPSAVPGFHISQGTKQSPTAKSNDIISMGIIDLEQARRYFDAYRNRLDHFPYRILNAESSLETIRASSPLLVAAICSVGALHLAETDFDACYAAFVSQSACQAFSKNCSANDVRAFVIGAFWLGDVSWTLVAAAVRIATEMQLHRSYYQAMQGDKAAYLNARLYYQVYACDHHFSVVFGRPPLTRQCHVIRNIRTFLECKHAVEDDARLASQVIRWGFMTEVFDTFGVDVGKPLSQSEIPKIHELRFTLDNLSGEWTNRFQRNAYVGNYPNKGSTIHYEMARLYLCSHAFRGAGIHRNEIPGDANITPELQDTATSAIDAALSIIKTVIEDDEVRAFLNGLPIYFDTMIAFAVVFIVKVTSKFPDTLPCSVNDMLNTLRTLQLKLQQITAAMHAKHLLVNITRGIASLVHRLGEDAERENLGLNNGQPSAQLPSTTEQLDQNADWGTEGIYDPYCMGTYDLLLNQEMNLGNFAFDGKEATFNG